MGVFGDLFGGRRRPPPRRAAIIRSEPRLPVLRAHRTPTPATLPDQQELQDALREAFTPTRPQRSRKRLAGRTPELRRIFHAITQERAHVVLYGERGRGKTSLVNLVASAARSSGYMVARYSCAFDSDFEEIMRGLARDLPRSLLVVPAMDDVLGDGCDAALPRAKLYPRDVALLPGRLAGGHLLLIVDEFDRVTDALTRTRFADTIKQISDRGASLSFMLVGVSDSLEELLGRHPSIQRNVVGVPIPLLSETQVDEIIEIGSRNARLDFPPDVRRVVTEMARGVPYIVHLLCLHGGERALRRGANTVNQEDMLGAIQQSVLEIDPRVAVLYASLTQGDEDIAMVHLLQEIAGGRQDRFGRFSVQETATEMIVAGRSVPHHDWQRLIETDTLRACKGVGFGVYTFAEPMLPHYVLLRAVSDGLSRARRKEADVLS
jgi:hypothetical protein